MYIFADMKNYIANIVSVNKQVNGKMFNIVDSLDKIDPRFPTLIIGWDNVEGKYPNVSILDWKINDNLFWTHYKNIKRTRFESDLRRFKELSLSRLNDYISYNSFSLITATNDRIDNMFRSLSDNNSKYCYITDNEIFVYYASLKKVIGISLDEASYMGYNVNDIKRYIRVPSNKVIYNDYDIPFDIKNREEYQRYMVPFLMELFESE